METHSNQYIHYACRALFIALLLSTILGGDGHSQTPEQVVANSNAFSPTITSYRLPSSEVPSLSANRQGLVCAYTYVDNNDNRRIGIKRSTDNGQTWITDDGNGNTISLPMPKWQNGTNSLDNLDDPQLITLHQNSSTGVILLAVRAWNKGSNVEGFFHEEQPFSIFKKCGIYIITSTNYGKTWASNWTAVAENTSPSGSGNRFTLENPRLAFRPEFDDYGYIVWGKRAYQGSDGSIGGNPSLDLTTGCDVGIAAFDWSGNLLTSNSGNAMPYIVWHEDSPNQNTVATFSELRPSVAIAPDKSIWISFYTVQLGSDESCLEGKAPPEMGVFLVKGTRTISSSDCVFHFDEKPKAINPLTADCPSGSEPMSAVGLWDNTRGYLYVGLTTDEFFVDLAQGPSIQIVANNFFSCKSEFQVGVIHTFTQRVDGRDDGCPGDIPTTGFRYKSMLAFYSINATSSDNATSLVQQISDPSIWPARAVDIDASFSSTDPSNFNFFPILKYTYYNEFGHNAKVPNGEQVLLRQDKAGTIPSRFIVSYMSCQWSKDGTHNKHLDRTQCKAGVSFDDKTFSLTKFTTPTNSLERFIRGSEGQHGSGSIDPEFEHWGCKLDLCGSFAYNHTSPIVDAFDAHPIWHSIIPGNAGSQKLLTNTGNIIHAKASVLGALYTQPNAFPQGGFFQINGTGGFIWGDFGYYDFDDNNRPNSILAQTPVSIGPYGSLVNNHPTLGDGHDFYPTIGSTPVQYGFYYGIYKNSETTDPGKLSFSNQRRVVSLGKVLFGVFEKNGNVYYSTKMDIDDGGEISTDYATSDLLWQTSEQVNTSNEAAHPSIAIYQEYIGAELTGRGAIAVVWADHTDNTGTGVPIWKVSFRTREFDLCKGDWGTWSDVFDMFQYTTSNAANVGVVPVVSPLVALNTSNSGGGPQSTYLLGWNVVWSGPHKDGSLYDDECQKSIRSGLYTRSWLRVPPSGQNTINTQNENWGHYGSKTSPAYALSNSIGLRPNLTEPIKILLEPSSACAQVQTIGYPTIVNHQNKVLQPDDASNNNYAQEIAFSTENGMCGIWVLTAKYRKTASGSDHIGDLISATSPPIAIGYSPMPFGWGQIGGKSHSSWNCPLAYERNPSITINSSGQMFLTWERMEKYNSTGNAPLKFGSKIPIAQSYYRSNYSWVQSKKRKFVTIISDKANSANLNDWLRNPSITAFPLSTLHSDANDPLDDPYDQSGNLIPNKDRDPAAAELLFWRHGKQIGNTRTEINELYSTTYSEHLGDQKAQGKGYWNAIGDNILTTALYTEGQFSHRSFGQYNSGPTFGGRNGLTNEFLLSGEGSAACGNDVSNPDGIVFHNHLQLVAMKGTYANRLPVTLYRGESIQSDSGAIRFVWGDVSVSDTGSSPMRQVALHFGLDSVEYASSAAARDSIFRTEVFDFPEGGEITYFRSLYLSDTAMVKPGGMLYDSSKSIRYTVELVFASSGNIDTIERIEISPAYGKTIVPMVVHAQNTSHHYPDVFLRIRGEIVNVVPPGDIDSLTTFEDEQAFTVYDHDMDTTIVAFKGAAYPSSQARGKASLDVLPSSPNPVHCKSEVVTYFSAPEGTVAKVELYDALGHTVYEPTYYAAGKEWTRFSLKAPPTPGIYYLRISSFGKTKTLVISAIE